MKSVVGEGMLSLPAGIAGGTGVETLGKALGVPEKMAGNPMVMVDKNPIRNGMFNCLTQKNGSF